MTGKRDRQYVVLCLAILLAGLVFACTGCMSEERRDDQGVTRTYHQGMLAPEFIRLFLGGRLGSADPNPPAR